MTMTQNMRRAARLYKMLGKGFAGLAISAAFTIAGLPWTWGERFGGPPEWLIQRLAASHRADCPLTPSPDRTQASRTPASQQPGWWL